jgi:hypothetical protein
MDKETGTGSGGSRPGARSPSEARPAGLRRYAGPFSAVNGTFAATDALGRVLPLDVPRDTADPPGGREVGVFFFLWQGRHGTAGPYDNSVIGRVPGATVSEKAWMEAGGGPISAMHFWGKPLFGYYTSDDTWVMRRQIQMLTDAGVDYIVVDNTNAATYTEQVLALMGILGEYDRKGIRVPRIAFYTNSYSGRTVNRIYETVYKAHPEYSGLWYRRDGRPVIIGRTDDPELSDEARGFFRIKLSQWPNEERRDDGFPWMEFDRLLSDRAVYGPGGTREMLNVSVAQHSDTITMSATAYYGANDRTRSYHDGANDRSENAMLYGYNFAEQWEWALRQNVSNVFVTGWNEWVAQRQPPVPEYPVRFIDCCDPDTSRDVEPMDGPLGDNYYMQLISGIRRFKGTAPRVDAGGYVTVDVRDPAAAAAAFGAAPAVYEDFPDDCGPRDSVGFGGIPYRSEAGVNDLLRMAVLRDRDYLYFSAEVAGDSVCEKPEGRMTLLIRPEAGNCGRVAPRLSSGGFAFAVNRAGAGDDGTVTVERAKEDGGWEPAGRAVYSVFGNRMTVAVPRALLGLPGATSEDEDLISLAFKWTDGCDTLDVRSFYLDGDAAPYGRLAYVYSNIE